MESHPLAHFRYLIILLVSSRVTEALQLGSHLNFLQFFSGVGALVIGYAKLYFNSEMLLCTLSVKLVDDGPLLNVFVQKCQEYPLH